MLGAHAGNFHSRGKRQLSVIHRLLQFRHKIIEPDIPLYGFLAHAVALAHAFKRELSSLGAVATRSLMLDGLILHFQGQGLFAGQNRFALTEVVIRHSENGLIVRHIADDTGHIAIPGKLAGHLAAVARDDLIAAALTGTYQRGLVDAAVADTLHQRFHFRIVTDTKRMILERVQVGKVKIDDFLFLGAGSVTGRRRHFRGRGRCLFFGGRMGLASLGRIGLLRGCLFRLGRTATAGLFRLFLFLGPRLGRRSFFSFCRAAPFGLGLLRLRHGLFPFLLAVLGDGNGRGLRFLGDVRRSVLFRRRTHSGKVDHLCGRSGGTAHIRDLGLLHFRGLSRHFRRGLFLRGRGMLVFFCHDTNNLLDKNLGHAARLAHFGTQRKRCLHTKTPPMSC